MKTDKNFSPRWVILGFKWSLKYATAQQRDWDFDKDGAEWMDFRYWPPEDQQRRGLLQKRCGPAPKKTQIQRQSAPRNPWAREAGNSETLEKVKISGDSSASLCRRILEAGRWGETPPAEKKMKGRSSTKKPFRSISFQKLQIYFAFHPKLTFLFCFVFFVFLQIKKIFHVNPHFPAKEQKCWWYARWPLGLDEENPPTQKEKKKTC